MKGPRPTLVELWAREEPQEPPIESAGAAVLMVLREAEGDVETLLIERTVHPADPASGQIALPGGRVDRTDRSLRQTALRECQEEVGIDATDLVAPPRFVELVDAPRFSLRVAVFAARMSERGKGPRAQSAEEVASVFWLPSARLAAIDRFQIETGLGVREVEATIYEGRAVWGFTLRVLRRFFLGVEP